MSAIKYWNDLLASVPKEQQVVYKHHHFVLNTRRNVRQFIIAFKDGTVVNAGLWNQGAIPQEIHIEDNVQGIFCALTKQPIELST